MQLKNILVNISCFLLLIFCNAEANAKSAKHKRTGSIYFSWGYNNEWYTNSTVSITQNSLGNNYQLLHVYAHDHPGWDEGILNKALTIPQYNYRLGYYFNEKQDIGIEGNFDHTKYLIGDGQTIHMVGMFNDTHVDQPLFFSQAQGFYYFLNNGANFLLFNFVKKYQLYRAKTNHFKLDLVGKAGIGPVIPHVQNSLFGQINDQGFQFGGWNTGIETAIRATFFRFGFIEFSQKVDYARYSNLAVYEGTAKQNFGTYELILSVGFILPATKHNPMFRRNPLVNNDAPATSSPVKIKD
jgi:hypothetical protein